MNQKSRLYKIIFFFIAFSIFCVFFASLSIAHYQRVLVVEKFVTEIQKGRNDEANKLVIRPEYHMCTVERCFDILEDWIITHQPFFLMSGGTFQGQYIDQSGEFGYWYIEVRRDLESYSSGGRIWQYGTRSAGNQDKDWQTIQQEGWDNSDDRMNIIRSFVLLLPFFLLLYWALFKGVVSVRQIFQKHLR